MLEKIKNACDNKDWSEICGLVVTDPVEFFTSFNVRGMKYIGKRRLEWLKTYAVARWDSQEYGSTTDFANLIARTIEKAGY